MKSLGRWYKADLSDGTRYCSLGRMLLRDWKDKPGFPGELKLWCLQFGLSARLMWPLSVYQILIFAAERI